MARTWYFLESSSEDGSRRAIELCERILSKPKLATWDRAEFKSKLGHCHMEEARRLRSVSSEKTIDALQKSIELILSSLWIGRNVKQLDNGQAIRWLAEPAFGLIEFIHMDVAPFVEMIERLPTYKHDIHIEGARVLVRALHRSAIWRSPNPLHKASNLLRRAQQKLKQAGDEDRNPGFYYLAEQLGEAQEALQNRSRPKPLD